MNNVNTNDKQMEIHTRARNKVLFELHQAYTKNLYFDSICNASEDKEDLCSPVVEDLALEMNEKKLSNSEKKYDMICYRCKRLLNVPSNISEVSEKLLDYAEEYEADVNFVQAVVWLKSATRSMKDVSVEQYYLIFHKQWNNIQNNKSFVGEGSQYQTITVGADTRESFNSIIHCSYGQENNRGSYNDSEHTNNINLSSSVNSKEMLDLLQSGHRQQSKSDDAVSIGNSSSTFYSPTSSEKFLDTQSFARNETIFNSCIIPESNEIHSSISDMFSDSLDNEVSNNAMWNKEDQKLHEENNLITNNSIERLSLLPQNSINMQTEFLQSEHNVIVASNEDNYLLTSNTIIFSGQFSDNKNSCLSSNSANDDIISLQKDSAYDTYQLCAECTPTSNDILQNENNNVLFDQEATGITFYRKDNSVQHVDDLKNVTTNMIDRDSISDASNLSYHCKNDVRIKRTKVHCVENQDTLTCSENEYSQREIGTIENKECESSNNKKKKLEVTHETEREIPQAKKRFLERDLKKKEEKMISFEWMRYTLNALHVDDVAFQSMKVILSVLQNERIAELYMKKKCWKNTFEEQAVHAVLNFCEIIEAENKTAACRKEIVQAITNTLNKSVENTELNKVTILTYHVCIILELCNSAKICIETINYLITRLKSYESILIGLMNGNKADVHDTINQLHVILYALNICLQKYRLIFPNKQHSQFVEETVLSVTDLWKKQLTREDVITEDKAEVRERRWLTVLNDFIVISVENCSLFVDKLQMLINLIMRE